MLILWVATGARIAAGLIFILAGITKIISPGSFAASVMAYDILPVNLVAVLALVLPWLELAIGALLVAGLFTRQAAIAAIGFLGVFIIAIAQAALRGRSLEGCGCFGDIATTYPLLGFFLGGENSGPWDIVRDLIYGALALLAARYPDQPLSLDAVRARLNGD